MTAPAHPAASPHTAAQAGAATPGTAADIGANATSPDTAAAPLSTGDAAEPDAPTLHDTPVDATPAEPDTEADADTADNANPEAADAADVDEAEADYDADYDAARDAAHDETDYDADADYDADEAADDDPSTSQGTPHHPLPSLADSLPLPARLRAPAAAFGRLMSRRSPLVHIAVLAVAWVLALGGVALLWQGLPGGAGGAGIWGFVGLLMACVGCGLGVAQAVPVARTREPEISASGWAVAGLATAVIGGLGVVAVVAINEIAWVWNRIG